MADTQLLAHVVEVLRAIERCSKDDGSPASVATLAATVGQPAPGLAGTENARQLHQKLAEVCGALAAWADAAPDLDALREQHRILEYAVIRFWKHQTGEP